VDGPLTASTCHEEALKEVLLLPLEMLARTLNRVVKH
jgi:hypothetical protein